MNKTSGFKEEEFQVLLDGIPDALVHIGADMRIIWANRATGRFLGMEENAITGRYCFEVWHMRSSPCEICPVQRCFSTGQPQEEIITFRNNVKLGVKAFPLFGSEGNVVSVIELNADITEKLRLRDESVHKSRLASLGELSAGIAHEINNPNALILLNAPVLQEACESMLTLLEEKYLAEGDFLLGRFPYSRMRSELPRLHKGVSDAAGRIRRIVEELKNFARKGSGAPEETADVNEAAGAALGLLGNYLQKSTLLFKTYLQENLPPIRGDVLRIEQVVVNLLLNSCQALPDEKRGITLRTRSDEEGGSVQLIVSDEGIGIPSENLTRIMEPFFTTRRSSGGTGLGLSVSASIVKEYGGNIHVDSAPGQGTTITVTFPKICPK